MGLKSFLKQQGFIEESSKDKTKASKDTSQTQQPTPDITPTFFPLSSSLDAGTSSSAAATSPDPSFVTPLQQHTTQQQLPDPTFVKFFEDELVKANKPGLDYFEFRQLLNKTQQKMAAKGVTAPEVVLQAVLMSFEAQEISPVKLVEAARQYKDILKQKNEDFLQGASKEKNNQLQKRQSVLQSHDEAIKKLQQQLQQLEVQKQQLEQSITKEKTQMEVDKSLGKEGIEKIEKAQQLISLAHNYIQSSIDTDIKRLQSV